jgi:hypothetical protein
LSHLQPFQVTGFHGCDRDVGLSILNGKKDLLLSDNPWDWLGPGVYFWEQNPQRALQYATECAKRIQFSRGNISNPFVLGATIELGKCLNLVEPESLEILRSSYEDIRKIYAEAGEKLPKNVDNKSALDCAVIKHVHQSRKLKNFEPYDTIRSAFNEGGEIYPGANFTLRHHIQICVLKTDLIKGYFLPRPLTDYNPYLDKDFQNK